METNIKCETAQELKYLMTFFGIKSMPIFISGRYVGIVSDDFKYSKEHAMFRLSKDVDAVSLAIKQIPEYLEAVKLFRSKETVAKSVVRYVNDRAESESLEEGTLDSIFEKVERSNNRLRYCNGSFFKFKDDTDEHLFYLWGLSISRQRSFDLYYGNGIVD